MTTKNYKPIKGSGGGKSGGGGSFREDENTLQTSQTIRQLYALGAGPIGGLVNGAKSIFVNGVAVQNSDGKYNFGGKVVWDERKGLPSQAYMEGFPSANAEFGVGVEVTTTTPRVQTTSTASVDAMRVTIGLPNGLYQQLTDEARLTGAVVKLALDKKLTSSGTWVQDRVVTIDGKTMSAYAQSYTVRRPSGTGTFDVRLRRITADSTAAGLVNKTFWNSYTEVEFAKLEYENIALVGVAINAKDLSSQQQPVIAFEVYGTICRVPSNYNPATRTYSGIWDGTFKMAWTDNPAWCLYDLLTDPENGMGYRITDDRVDKYAFYSAGVYADGMVDNGAGGTEPRFRCNVPIEKREQGLRVANYLASSMRAKVVWGGGKVSLIQDRPGSPVRQIGTSDVVNGLFTYTSSTLPEQHTAVRVTWFNPEEDYLQDIEVVDAASETGAWKTFLQGWQNEHGYNEVEHTAYACTSRGQAKREGRWLLNSLLKQNEFVKFQMSFNGMGLQVNDIVELFDSHRSGQTNAGRTIDGSTTTVIKLDRPATLTAGSSIQLVMPTGVIERNIVETSGTLDTVTLSSALPSVPAAGTSYGVTTNVKPKPYRITKIGLEGKHIANIEAMFYDAGKYAFVEDGIVLSAPVFTPRPPRITSAPRNLAFNERASVVDDVVKRSLHLGWDAPLTGNVVSYTVQYRIAGGKWLSENTSSNTLEIEGIVPGVFECKVIPISHLGLGGPELRGTYTVTNTTATGSSLDAVTNLRERNTNSTTAFPGNDINIKWTNPGTNGTKSVALKDFKIEVLNPADDTVIRTEYVRAVPGGEVQTFRYSYSMNNEDTGNAPRRSVKFSVRCRDANNKLSAATAVTLTNAAPALPSAMAIVAGVGNIKITYTLPTEPDFKGVLIWRSTTSGFTPSAGNLVYDTTDNYISDSGLTAGTAYYYRVASYDTFGKSNTGAGLTLSSELTATPAQTGIPQGSSLPATGSEGDLFFLTTDDKLYRYTGTAWTAAVPAVDVTGQLTDAQLEAISAAKLTGQIGTTQIADGALTTAKFASTLKPIEVVSALPGTPHVEGRTVYLTTDNKLYRNTGSGWMASIPASDLTGQITSTQITDNAVTTPKIATGAVTANELAANSVVAGKVAAGAITATEIAANSISVKQLALTDFNNLIPNGILSTGDLTGFYTNATGTSAPPEGWTVANKDASTSAAYVNAPTLYVLRAAPSTTENTGVYCSPGFHDCAGGDKFYSSVEAAMVGGSSNYVTNTFRYIVYWLHNDGSQTSASYYWSFMGTGWSLNENVLTAPSTAVGVRLRLFHNNSSGNQNTILVSNITLRRMNEGRLIVDGAITTTKIAAGAVTANEIAANAITAAKIASGTITATQIAAGAVTASELATNSVTSAKIAADAVTAGKIAAATITSAEIASGTITAANIASNTITADKMVTGTITAASGIIANGAITNAKIGNSIQSNNFNGTVDSSGNITANGSAGWALGKAGDAVFRNVVVRGDVQATSLNGSGIVATGNIGASAVTGVSTATSSTVASPLTLSVTTAADDHALVVLVDSGASYTGADGESSDGATYVDYSILSVNGSEVARGKGTYMYVITNTTTGTVALSLQRVRYGGGNGRNHRIVAIRSKR